MSTIMCWSSPILELAMLLQVLMDLRVNVYSRVLWIQIICYISRVVTGM